MTPDLDKREEKLLQLIEEALKLGFAELIIQIQDGKAVSAALTKKIKLTS